MPKYSHPSLTADLQMLCRLGSQLANHRLSSAALHWVDRYVGAIQTHPGSLVSDLPSFPPNAVTGFVAVYHVSQATSTSEGYFYRRVAVWGTAAYMFSLVTNIIVTGLIGALVLLFRLDAFGPDTREQHPGFGGCPAPYRPTWGSNTPKCIVVLSL